MEKTRVKLFLILVVSKTFKSLKFKFHSQLYLDEKYIFKHIYT